MKKQLLALSLVATSGLIAAQNNDTNSTQEQSGCCQSCFCSPCCCKPCCVPKPKKCIDCECYTPMYYDLQCDCGFFFEADFLYWYSRETNLSYGLEVIGFAPEVGPPPVATQVIFSLPKSYKDLKASWDPGVRIGAGMNSSCDGWDYYFSWTWLKSCKSQTSNGCGETDSAVVTEAGSTLILNPWVESAVFQTPFFSTVKAKWELTLNLFDLEIGRRYWLSRCFTMRPFLGLRGAWTETNFNIESTLGPITLELLQNQQEKTCDHYNNEVWGVGIVGGFQPSWYFTPCFSLFGNVAVSALWGDYNSKKTASVFVTGDGQIEGITLSGKNETHRDTSKMQSIIDLAIGLRWEDTWCCDRYRTALDIGWEHHMWINHGAYSRTLGREGGAILSPTAPSQVYPTSYVSNVTDLGFGGLVIRARFDF
jgi:hypothetical protein